MNNTFEILRPHLFPDNAVISGVTKRNLHLFPDKGFSISNLDYYSDEEIDSHRKELANKLGLNYEQLKFQKQVHKTDIQIVTSKTPNGLETDGMITSDKGIVLNVSIADCLAILIFDPVHAVVGAIHSGWRGTKENIAKKAVELLNSKYDTKPKDLLVYLSPCASGKRYEIGYDVARYFPDTTKQISDEKYLFDNRKQVYKQLIELGVKENMIEMSNICTIENLEYHSFRRDNDKSGRMSAFICLRDNF